MYPHPNETVSSNRLRGRAFILQCRGFCRGQNDPGKTRTGNLGFRETNTLYIRPQDLCSVSIGARIHGSLGARFDFLERAFPAALHFFFPFVGLQPRSGAGHRQRTIRGTRALPTELGGPGCQ